jgi:hypothetical protein
MRTLLVVFSTIIAIHSGLSQSTLYFNTYDFGAGANPVFVYPIETENGFIIQGQIKSPNTKNYFNKLSLNGNLIDNYIYGDSTSGTYIIFPMINYIESKLLCNIGWENVSQGITSRTFLEIDTSLQIIRDSTFFINSNYLNNAYLKRVIFLNNKLYFGGATYLNANGDSIYPFNFLFWKTDTNFNYITHKSIGVETAQEDLMSIQAGFDSNLLLGGLTLANGNQQDWYLVNCDTNGNVLGEYFYGHPTGIDQDGIKSMSRGFDSTYFLAGVFHKYYVPPSTYSHRTPTIVKIDRQLNTIWTKHYGKPIPSTSLQRIVTTYDYCHAILVQRPPYNFYTRVYSQVTKINNDGDVLWSRNYYQGDTTDYIRYRAWDMIETSDSGFAFCGSAIDTINVGPYQQAWLVKTDSLGCDGLRSCNDTALVVEILNFPDTLCQNDTNFVEVRLKGRSAPYSLYANSTMVLDSIYYPYTLPLWIDTTIMVFPTDTGWQPLVVTLHEPWERIASDTVQVYVVHCPTTYASQDFYKRKVEIFPNPASTELHVKIRGVISGAYTITLYDIQGKPIRCITTKETETVLDISLLPVGVYGVKVVGNGVYRTERVVKGE